MRIHGLVLAFTLFVAIPVNAEDDAEEFKDTLATTFSESDGVITLGANNWSEYQDICYGGIDFACSLVPEFSEKCEAAKKSDYLKDKLRKDVRRSKLVKQRLRKARRFLGKKIFVAPAKRIKEVRYSRGKFIAPFLVLEGRNIRRWDKLQQSSLWGGATSGVAVGTWRRIKWRKHYGTTAEIPLRGLPKDLKPNIESEFGSSYTARWSWKGLAKAKSHKSGVMMGYIMTSTWLIPKRLSLEFVDKDEKVVYKLK